MSSVLEIRKQYSTSELNGIFRDHSFWRRLENASRGGYYCHLHDPMARLRSDKWETDAEISLNQQSAKFINYRDWSRGGQICSMKAGKFFIELYKQIDPENMNEEDRFDQRELELLGEIFSTKWKNYVEEMTGKYQLVIDDDFKPLYDSNCHAGRIASCMNDSWYWQFYRDAVKAKAASLKDDNGKIVARCILFPEVHEKESDKIWRMAERQYAIAPHLKVALINALIKAKKIDCYKKWDAECSAADNIVSIEGESLRSKTLWIDCSLRPGDTVAYQDSFKYFCEGTGRAYNDSSVGYDFGLDITDGVYEEEEEDEMNFDSWNEEDTTDEVYPVMANGRRYYTTDYTRDNDFRYVERHDEYFYYEEVYYDEISGEDEREDECLDFYSMDDDGELQESDILTHEDNLVECPRLSEREGKKVRLLATKAKWCDETGQQEPAQWVRFDDETKRTYFIGPNDEE